MAIARVEPLVTARALRGPFDYALPERLANVDVGSVLLVPFGRQRLLGVVVELAERSELPPERLAEPIKALAAGVTLYVAASNLVPEFQQKRGWRPPLAFFGGVVALLLVRLLDIGP